MDYKTAIMAIAAGLCTAGGIYTFLAGYEIIGLMVFLIGVGNTYLFINLLEREAETKKIRLWFKYSGFVIILLGALIGLIQGEWDRFSLSMVYFGLFMLISGLIIRGKRFSS